MSSDASNKFPAFNSPKKVTSLHTILTVPFVLLIVVPAMVIAGFSLFTGLSAVDVLSKQVMNNVTSRVAQAAIRQLEDAETTLRATFPDRRFNQNASLGMFTDDVWLERKLFELTGSVRTARNIYFAREDGSMLGVEHSIGDEAMSARVFVKGPGDSPSRIYASRGPLDRSQLKSTDNGTFHPEKRPWYLLAQANQGIVWTPPYPTFPSGSLVITAAQSVVTGSGAPVGVLAADVELKEISNFMKQVDVSKRGVAYIVDREGLIVASSTPEKPYKLLKGLQVRLPADESESALIRRAAIWWENSAAKSTDAKNLGEIKLNGETVDVSAQKVREIAGVDWDVVVAVPRTDFTGPIVVSAVAMFFVVFIALATALLLGLWVMRRVTRDVDQLVSATENIASDLLVERPIPQTTLSETQVLANAFSKMVQRVRDALITIRRQNTELADLNTSLEGRVAERTEALATQNETLSAEVERRIRLEQELRAISAASQKAAADKARFLAILSHELRTPLQAVVGASQIIAARKNELLNVSSNADADEIETMHAASKSLLSLIDGVLSYSRLEAGVVVPHLTYVNLEQCIKDALRVSGTARPRPGVKLDWVLDPLLPKYIETDEGMLREVLVNLVTNALKFTESGSVVVNAEGHRDNEHKDGADMVRFIVRDTGVGISPEVQKKLFQPFQQGGEDDLNQSGTGLGLVITSMLVESMGGKIKLESQVGKGTKISFSIKGGDLSVCNIQATEGAEVGLGSLKNPRKALDGENGEDVDARLMHQALRPLSQLESQHVLVVEDNVVNQTLLPLLLKQLGHTVKVVGDGPEAVELCAEEDFDVVLMDLNLPTFGGIEATKRIHSAAEIAKAPPPLIIAFTASVTDADRAHCVEVGMCGFLTKPATVNSIDIALQSAVKGGAPSRSEALYVSLEAPAVIAAAQPTAEELALDYEALEALNQIDKSASEPFLVAMLEQFINGLPTELADIKLEFEQNNFSKVHSKAHAMAGGASAVGATPLAKQAKALSNNPSRDGLIQVTASVQNTIQALRVWLDQSIR